MHALRLGRLPIIFSLENLTKDMLVKIMKEPRNAILKQYEKLLELSSEKIMDSLPKNSGIIPKLRRSSKVTCCSRFGSSSYLSFNG